MRSAGPDRVSAGGAPRGRLSRSWTLLLLLVPSVAPALEPVPACTPPGPAREAIVGHVVDGDTLRTSDGELIRLLGLNTPELGRDGRPDEPGADAARDALACLLYTSDAADE